MHHKYMFSSDVPAAIHPPTQDHAMKRLLTLTATFTLLLVCVLQPLSAADAQPAAGVNTVCPISGKPADPKITTVYEGITYAFADDASRSAFTQAREKSLYHRLGGKAALDAVVEAFYVKVLADARIKHHFDDINMDTQRRKQKAFLAAAFGGPTPWTGKDMRRAHADLKLTEADFTAVAENLVATLKDFQVKQELIDEVVAIALSVKDAVLNRPQPAK